MFFSVLSERRTTLSVDKAYGSKDFVKAARMLDVTARVTKNTDKRRSNLDWRTALQVDYAINL